MCGAATGWAGGRHMAENIWLLLLAFALLVYLTYALLRPEKF